MKEVLTDENIRELAHYRMTRAHETFDEVPFLLEKGYYNTATNRLYYACYYAAVALLVSHRIFTYTHSGVKTSLGIHFVLKNLITKESGRAFSNLFESRQRSDYDEFAYSTREEVEELYPKAKKFIDEIEHLLAHVDKED